MYKFDKTAYKAQTFAESERENVFQKDVSLTERLNQAWYLSAMAHGLNPYDPPKMIKKFVSTRKHNK